MLNNSPKPINTAIKAIILYTLGVQVIRIRLGSSYIPLISPLQGGGSGCGGWKSGLGFRLHGRELKV